MTTITLNANLDTQVRSIAQQAKASVDEIVNDILAKYLGSGNTEITSNAEQWKKLLASMPNVGNDDDFSRPLDYGREQAWDF
jgi:hypothetical protein